MKIFAKLVIVIQIVFMVTLFSCMNKYKNDPKYLDREQVVKSYYRGSDSIKDEKSKSEARKYLKQSIVSLEDKNIYTAFQNIEKSLETKILPESYFHYGNCFFAAGDYEQAISAYSISIDVYYELKYSAYLKIAYCYSFLEKADLCFENLEKAVLYGIPEIETLKSDSKLSFIRTQTDWEKNLAKYIALFEKGNDPSIFKNKSFTESSASTLNEYSFSAGGTTRVHYIISDDRNHFKFGTWKYTNYFLKILWNTESGEKGIGEPKHCGATCDWDQYEKYSKSIAETELYSRDDLYLVFKIKDFEFE
jgi:tetratricopeptide (TPR) repeat protein